MSKLRQGDLLLYDTNDGGNISVSNGEPTMDGGFESAVYLSIFGHDKGKDGQISYWADEFMNDSQKPGGLFYSFISGEAKTVPNLLKARQLLLQDLQWFLDDNVADSVDVELISTDRNTVSAKIEIFKNQETLFENTYQIHWGFQQNDPANKRI